MNLQKHSQVIIYLGATGATFGITAVLKFMAGAFGLADTIEFRMGLGFLACIIWIYASRAIVALITPRCPVCGRKPCPYPRCAQCGRNLEPHHAAAAGEEPCGCGPQK